MTDLTVSVPKQNNSYSICLRKDFTDLSSQLFLSGLKPDKTAVIADTNTAPLYAEAVLKCLSEACGNAELIILPAGETAKTLMSVQEIYNQLISLEFSRRSLLISLGGGVIGDMTGFAAATYMRGIPFVQIPTTLLSMVDASIGGKTGFDYLSYKNMIGAFHMPSLVYINTDVLKTLPGREFAGGMAEIIKAALIRDAAFNEQLLSESDRLLALEPEAVAPMIRKACLIKKDIVEQDPFEGGQRMLLNFGHTLGHAIEKAKGFSLTHGECVALGMIAAARISLSRGLLTRQESELIEEECRLFDLPLTVSGLSSDEVIRNTLGDKKRSNGSTRFILLDGIGCGIIVNDVTEEEMAGALSAVIV